MRYRTIGTSDLSVSVVGLGCNTFGWRIDAARADAVIGTALDLGVTFFDTADSYSDSEIILGRALSRHRADVVLATKFGSDLGGRLGDDASGRGARAYIRRAIESSLSRLATDYIDLYQMHWPDPSTPIDETLAALQELISEGKVRYIGCSNFAAWQIMDADWTARTMSAARFVSAQNRYNLLDRNAEAGLVPVCEKLGIGIIPYHPLARGLLTGKYNELKAPPEGSRLDGMSSEDFGRLSAIAHRIAEFARARGHTLLDAAISGLLSVPSVASVIAGATTPAQVRANVSASDWQLDGSDIGELRRMTDG